MSHFADLTNGRLGGGLSVDALATLHAVCSRGIQEQVQDLQWSVAGKTDVSVSAGET
jgi:hypothetical protein